MNACQGSSSSKQIGNGKTDEPEPTCSKTMEGKTTKSVNIAKQNEMVKSPSDSDEWELQGKGQRHLKQPGRKLDEELSKLRSSRWILLVSTRIGGS